MSVPRYTEPPEFQTGQILGRAHLGILQDNDDLFNALADRWRPAFAGRQTTWIASELSRECFDGYILLEGDAETLYYSFTLSGCDADPDWATATLYMDYGGGSQDTIDTQIGNGTSSGSYDASGFAAGLYRVYCQMTRVDNTDSTSAVCLCHAPYAIYTGAYSTVVPDVMVDGAVLTAANLNKWRSNDLYFNAETPRQVAFGGMKRNHTGSATESVLFDGQIKWHACHYKVYYGVWLESILSGNHITIYFDYDAAVAQQSTTISTAGVSESSWTLANPGNYTKGTFYRVRVELHRTNTDNNPEGEIRYLYFTAPALDATYIVMDPFTVAQFVYGNTAGQLTRLFYLTTNDASIYDRLVWGAAVAPRNVVCQVPAWTILGETVTGDFRLVRRYSWLYYRVEGAELRWGTDNSYTLEDYGSDTYKTLDLNSLDLPPGTVYYITGDTLHFAQEVP